MKGSHSRIMANSLSMPGCCCCWEKVGIDLIPGLLKTDVRPAGLDWTEERGLGDGVWKGVA